MLILLTEEQLMLSYCWQMLSPIHMNAEEYHWKNLCLVSAKAEEKFHFYSLYLAAESLKQDIGPSLQTLSEYKPLRYYS